MKINPIKVWIRKNKIEGLCNHRVVTKKMAEQHSSCEELGHYKCQYSKVVTNYSAQEEK